MENTDEMELTDMLMFEDMETIPDVAEKPAFVPAEAKQKQKNRDKRKDKVKESVTQPAPEVGGVTDHTSGSSDQPIPLKSAEVTGSETAPATDVQALFDAFDDLRDAVPDLFEASAKTASAARAILPIPPAVAIVGVAALAGLACYLDMRREK